MVPDALTSKHLGFRSKIVRLFNPVKVTGQQQKTLAYSIICPLSVHYNSIMYYRTAPGSSSIRTLDLGMMRHMPYHCATATCTCKTVLRLVKIDKSCRLGQVWLGQVRLGQVRLGQVRLVHILAVKNSGAFVKCKTSAPLVSTLFFPRTLWFDFIK